MHIAIFKNLESLKFLNSLFANSILQKEAKNNYNHLTINNNIYFKIKEKGIFEKIKKEFKKLNISQVDIISNLQYKPGIKFVNPKGEEIENSGHKVFFLDDVSKFNILQVFNYVYNQNGIVVIYDWNFSLFEKIEKAKEIKEIAIKYEQKKAEIEKKYQKELENLKKQKEEYQKKLQEYRQAKREVEEFNKKEKILAKKEKREPNLKKLEKNPPVKPKLERPKKEKVNMPIQLDSIRLKDNLNEILLTYLFEIKRNLELNAYILIPSRELQGSVFKRENLLQLNEIKEIDRKKFLNIIEKKIEEENENLKIEKKNFFNPFVYGYSSSSSNNKYINVEAIIALLEINNTFTQWDSLDNFSNPQKERELPVLTKLKPNQTASMLAGGIGTFAKEIEMNGEKLLIKGATVKNRTKKEINVNNMVIEETVETYNQEIGVLNLSRRELQIIK